MILPNYRRFSALLPETLCGRGIFRFCCKSIGQLRKHVVEWTILYTAWTGNKRNVPQADRTVRLTAFVPPWEKTVDMSKIWEAFENLQEIVYVVDAKKYDLVYMNQLARSTFNCPRTEDYRGRKCYELLQGLPKPCGFCSDARGKGIYTLKEKLIEQDGRTYRLGMAVDIAGQEEAERTLYTLLENEG